MHLIFSSFSSKIVKKCPRPVSLLGVKQKNTQRIKNATVKQRVILKLGLYFKWKIFGSSYTFRQGRFQDFFQGVTEISSGGGENLPGGGEKNFAATPSPQRFLLSYTQLLIYAHFFTFYTHVIKKYIIYICFLILFLVRLLYLIRKFPSTF